jgi:arylsulfatase A-like enzyme
MGPRGDAIVQMDYMVGEVTKLLEIEGIAEHTIIIFTSDNGPVLNDGYNDQAAELVGDHNPSGPFRGGKYSIYEAGTRVPMIVYWPGTIKPMKSAAMMTQLDFYASFADMLEMKKGEKVIDSENHLSALLGKTENGRKVMLEEGFTLGLRDEHWKYIEPFTDGSIPEWMENKEIESGLQSEPQLYNLSEDKGEKNNLALEKPELVKEYGELLKKIKTKTKG